MVLVSAARDMEHKSAKVRARGRIDVVRVLARIDKVLGHAAAAKLEMEVTNMPALEFLIHRPDPDNPPDGGVTCGGPVYRWHLRYH